MSIRVDGQLFQSTLPQGERRQSCAYVARYIIFQSTLPQGERHNCLCSLIQQSYFNPRSHKGSDDARKFNATANKISIHAPTRGATQNLLSLNHIKAISIHAPTRGATCSRQHLFRICYKFQSTLPQGERQVCYGKSKDFWIFQSTLPQGERPGDIYVFAIIFFISIHAPTRGAT